MAKMSTGKIIGIVAGCLAFLFLVSGGCFFLGLVGASMPETRRPANIYEIRIDGLVTAGQQGGILGMAGTTPELVMAQLEVAEEDPAIQAILVRVNSPGGSPAASQEIYQELGKATKPVVVSVADSATSGAYYIACAADVIVANRASSIGGIGVILQVVNLEGLYDKLGIEYTTITQGQYKDIGATDRPMTEQEKKLLEDQTHKLYQQFMQDVAQSRGLELEKVTELATGWMYLGTEALELGLVDEVGTYKDAVDIAAELGGILEPKVTTRRELSILDLILSYYASELQQRIFGSHLEQQYFYR